MEIQNNRDAVNKERVAIMSNDMQHTDDLDTWLG